jgi:hypothetical protein
MWRAAARGKPQEQTLFPRKIQRPTYIESRMSEYYLSAVYMVIYGFPKFAEHEKTDEDICQKVKQATL